MRYLFAIAFGAAALVLGGCDDSSPVTGSDTDNATLPFAVAKSTTAKREGISNDPSLVSNQAAAINTFGLDLYKQICTEGSNVFFSPYSIQAALGMTDAGARGQTDTQIREALRVTLEGEDFHAAMNSLDLELMGHTSTTDGVALNIVNSIWARTNWTMKLAFLDILARYYDAGVNLLDFGNQPEQSRITINDWVSDQTNDKIKDLLPQGTITPDVYLVLTNAIYFLADWLYTFDANLTEQRSFTRLDNSSVTVDMMQLGKDDEQLTLRYDWDEAAQVRALELPYRGNRLAMTLMLPEPGTFTSFEQQLDTTLLNRIVAGLDSTDLPPVRLPRFTFTTPSIDLKTALKNMGMVDAFTGSADFSGIDGKRHLFVSDVIHKAFIAVDEQGTEAAAATAVVMRETSMPLHTPRFEADRPFVYCIRDTQTGVILFMGRALDPTVKE